MNQFFLDDVFPMAHLTAEGLALRNGQGPCSGRRGYKYQYHSEWCNWRWWGRWRGWCRFLGRRRWGASARGLWPSRLLEVAQEQLPNHCPAEIEPMERQQVKLASTSLHYRLLEMRWTNCWKRTPWGNYMMTLHHVASKGVHDTIITITLAKSNL